MTTLTIREVFQAGTDAFNAHDIDAFAELLADDVVFDAPGMPRDSGRAACAAVHEAGDGVMVEGGRFVGTHAGPLMTPGGAIPATGRSVEVPYVHVLHFRDGRHVFLGLTFDRLLMLEQLGLAAAV